MTDSFAIRVSAMLAGEFVSKACVMAAFVWLARTLDPAVYGEAEWALSLTMVVALAADAGLSTWGAARVAAMPQQTATLVAQIGWLRLTLAAPAYLGLLIVARAYGGRAGEALALYGLVLLLAPFVLQYLFNGLLQPRWAAVGQAIRGLAFVTVVIVIARRESPPSVVAIAELAGALALALCNLLVLRMVLKQPVNIRDGRRSLRSVLSQSWPIGASELTWGIHWYAGLIVLGLWAMTTEAAWQSASLRLILALHTIVWLYLYVLLPTLSRLIAEDPARWARTVEQSLQVTTWIGCAIAFVGTLAADAIMSAIFGSAFAAAVPAFRVGVWVIPIAWVSGHVRYSLIAAQQPRKEYHAALVGAGTTVVLSLFLAPTFGSFGTAMALLGGTIANAIAVLIVARDVLPPFALGRSVITKRDYHGHA